jgi:hypothetical protein
MRYRNILMEVTAVVPEGDDNLEIKNKVGRCGCVWKK